MSQKLENERGNCDQTSQARPQANGTTIREDIKDESCGCFICAGGDDNPMD
jgi:hypothetical protein